MVPPIVIGAHPRRHEPEPMELGAMLSRLTGAPLEVVGTYWFDTTPGRTAPRDFEQTLTEEARQALEHAVAGAPGELGEVRVHALSGFAANRLNELARELGAALIVVGSTHRGAVGRALGTTTNRVLEHAACPVAVAPRGFRDTGAGIARIGVAFADTTEGRAALRGAAAVARRTGGGLVVATFLEEHAHEVQRDRAEIELERAVAACARDLDVRPCLITNGADGLVELSTRLDMLVTGARSPGPLRLVRKLARQCGCPLLVVPRGLDVPLRSLFGAAVESDRPAAAS